MYSYEYIVQTRVKTRIDQYNILIKILPTQDGLPVISQLPLPLTLLQVAFRLLEAGNVLQTSGELQLTAITVPSVEGEGLI